MIAAMHTMITTLKIYIPDHFLLLLPALESDVEEISRLVVHFVIHATSHMLYSQISYYILRYPTYRDLGTALARPAVPSHGKL